MSELQLLENRIRSLLTDIPNDYDYLCYELDTNEEYGNHIKDREEAAIVDKIKVLYLAICVFLESKNLLEYLKDFKNKFQPVIDHGKWSEILAITQEHEEDEWGKLTLILDYTRYLSPFFDLPTSEIATDRWNRLINILRETSAILKMTKTTTIKNEATIYNQVKPIVSLIFPRTRQKNKARFISQFKTYSPDILVPEIETAVEYKLVGEDGNLEEYVNQLLIDSKAYKGDTEYKYFVAVLCMKERATYTEEQVRVLWDKHDFPKNWHLVLATL
jgi:hypothetical protein